MRFSLFEKWWNYDQIVSWHLLSIPAQSSLAFVVLPTLYLWCLWKILEFLYPWLRHFSFKPEWIYFLCCFPWDTVLCCPCLWRRLFYYVDNRLSKEQVYLVTFHNVSLKADKPHTLLNCYSKTFSSLAFFFRSINNFI